MLFLSNASAPCALFTLGVTVALRPLKKGAVGHAALTTIKLVIHPIVVFLLLSVFGPFDQMWVDTAVLMARCRRRSTCSCLHAAVRPLGRAASTAVQVAPLLSC